MSTIQLPPAPEMTATGIQAGQKCLTFAGRLIAGEVPARIGRRLTAAILAADAQMTRQAALERVMTLLDCGQGQSTWAKAQGIARALERFNGTPYRRIQRQDRAPTDLEKCLIVLLEIPGPRCAGKLWTEIRELTERG